MGPAQPLNHQGSPCPRFLIVRKYIHMSKWHGGPLKCFIWVQLICYIPHIYPKARHFPVAHSGEKLSQAGGASSLCLISSWVHVCLVGLMPSGSQCLQQYARVAATCFCHIAVATFQILLFFFICFHLCAFAHPTLLVKIFLLTTYVHWCLR